MEVLQPIVWELFVIEENRLRMVEYEVRQLSGTGRIDRPPDEGAASGRDLEPKRCRNDPAFAPVTRNVEGYFANESGTTDGGSIDLTRYQ